MIIIRFLRQRTTHKTSIRFRRKGWSGFRCINSALRTSSCRRIGGKTREIREKEKLAEDYYNINITTLRGFAVYVMLTSSVTASSAFVNASAAGHVLRRSLDIGVRVRNRVANAATSSAAHRTVVCRHRWRAYRPNVPASTSVAFRSVSSSVSVVALSRQCLFATLWHSSHRTRFSQYARRLVVSGSGCGRSRPCDMPVSRRRHNHQHRYHRTRQNDWHRRRRWLQQVGWTENTSTSLFNDDILYFFFFFSLLLILL